MSWASRWTIKYLLVQSLRASWFFNECLFPDDFLLKWRIHATPFCKVCAVLLHIVLISGPQPKSSLIIAYWVSKQVWNRLRNVCKQSEQRLGKFYFFVKNVFGSIKLLFQAFFWTANMKMEFLRNFPPIVSCSTLCSKLYEIGEKLLKNPI